jgi:SAM-dependent methyltransferase
MATLFAGSMNLRTYLRRGRFALGPIELHWEVRRRAPVRTSDAPPTTFSEPPYSLHIGPGPLWQKPNPRWLTADVDPVRADIVVNFNAFEGLPLADKTVNAIYASHVFEHISIYRCPRVLAECYRVLMPGGTIRIIVPDVATSIAHYVANDDRFPLFERRRRRAEETYGESYTLFECMKEDFISRSSQRNLLGEQLAHQNAWDFESLRAALVRAGFQADAVRRTSFQTTSCTHFSFEGTYSSEANEAYRSLYVEAAK